MDSTAHIPPTKVGFLGFREYDDDSKYRGAILITDEWGKPLEFRCTAPVCPSALQRTLYGQSLLPHILTELIGLPLIGSIREKPEVIFIVAADYFDLRQKIAMPLLKLRHARDGTKGRAEVNGKSKTVLLESVSGKFDQIQVEAHWKYPTDLDSCGERLRDLFGRWDLTEPFQRVTEGLDYVHQEGVLQS